MPVRLVVPFVGVLSPDAPIQGQQRSYAGHCWRSSGPDVASVNSAMRHIRADKFVPMDRSGLRGRLPVATALKISAICAVRCRTVAAMKERSRASKCARAASRTWARHSRHNECNRAMAASGAFRGVTKIDRDRTPDATRNCTEPEGLSGSRALNAGTS